MVKKEKIEADGMVSQALPNTTFRVKLDDGRVVLAHLAGKMRIRYVRIFPGDRVKIEMSPYGQTLGRIVYRYK